MCGIAGIILKTQSLDLDMSERLARMNAAMHHRGPDDGGHYITDDGRVGIANRRLAIRDISPAGHMPMCDEDQKVWITYNGEVYNADNLRSELEMAGYRFQSHTDTEVILKAYKHWGQRVLERLRGIFAFAIIDERAASAPSVLLARDQMGIKPLYYADTSHALVFASELKAIKASGLVSTEISPAGLVSYLRLGSVPTPLTIYRDIAALEPASFLSFSANQGFSLKPESYWHLPIDTARPSSDQVIESVTHKLAEAVRIQLVSDVPLGAFLSGGLDSSAVVAFMRQATNGPIRTCSISFNEQQYSEAKFARLMADAVGAEHFERVVTSADIKHEFDHIVIAMDQPSIDGVNTYFVSQTARQAGLTVALSGLGGDELFGGYPNTFGDVPRVYNVLRLAHALPGGAALARAAVRIIQRPGYNRLHDALSSQPSLAGAYLTRRSLFSSDEIRQLVNPDIWHAAEGAFNLNDHVSAQAASGDQSDVFSWVSRAELRTYTHHQLLRDTDVMSMAHSLEVRVPLLDTELVKMLLQLPSAIKTQFGDGPKPLLRRAIQQYVPPLIIERRDKQGFTFPFGIWLRNELRPEMRALISEQSSRKLLQHNVADSMLQAFENGQLHWSRVWSLAALASINA